MTETIDQKIQRLASDLERSRNDYKAARRMFMAAVASQPNGELVIPDVVLDNVDLKDTLFSRYYPVERKTIYQVKR